MYNSLKIKMGITCEGLSQTSYHIQQIDDKNEYKSPYKPVFINSYKDKNEDYWQNKNNASYRQKVQNNQQYAGDFTATDQYWDFIDKINQINTKENQQKKQKQIRHNTNDIKIKKQGQIALKKYSNQQKKSKDFDKQEVSENQALMDQIAKLERKKTQRQDRDSCMINLSQLKYSINEISGQNSALLTSENLQDTFQSMIYHLQAYQKTLLNLQEMFKEFAIEQKITSEAFKNIITKYSQNDELLNKKFIPLIVKIHSKIYDRLNKQLKEVMYNQINKKLKEHEIQLNKQQQANNFNGKIEALAAQLADKNKKLSQLEQQMSIQVAIVNSSQKQVQKYKSKVEQLEQANQTLQAKVQKYKTKLKPHLKKLKCRQTQIFQEVSQIEKRQKQLS